MVIRGFVNSRYAENFSRNLPADETDVESAGVMISITNLSDNDDNDYAVKDKITEGG